MILGVDVGGTFTDAVLFDGTAIVTAKSPTTTDDQSRGVLAAVELVLREAGREPSEVTAFTHGMTVGTNALLEENGARTALVVTEGFTDLLAIARQDRPSLYHLNRGKPRSLAPPELTFSVRERCGPEAVVVPLEEAEIARVVEELVGCQPEAVAICLLFSFVSSQHEERLAKAIASALPGRPVRPSHQVLAQFREYERCSTTVIDAYLAPPLERYLNRLVAAAARTGLPAPRVMQSSGGVLDAEQAAGSGAWSVLSGPAGGAVGAAAVARRAADGEAIGLDMGGTSCDVCLIEGGRVRRTDSRQIDGRLIQLPMIDIETVGAGGGSVAWADTGGALRVGPRSAGAVPGPACYGQGGTEATVTDANLLLGRLDGEEELPGGLRLDPQAAERALARLGKELSIEPLRAAQGIIALADQAMAGAVRKMTIERGMDPRGLALIPFGGAGPMHAAGIAGQLGISRIVCPPAGGVLSALGLCASERRRDAARTVLVAGDELTRERLAEIAQDLASTLAAEANDRIEVGFAMRYRGQGFELEVEAGPEPDPAELRQRFERLHEERYGFIDPAGEIEVVTVRVAAVTPAEPVFGVAPRISARRLADRPVFFDGGWASSAVFTGTPAPGESFDGPLIFEMPGTTLVLPPGSRATVDVDGNIVADLRQADE